MMAIIETTWGSRSPPISPSCLMMFLILLMMSSSRHLFVPRSFAELHTTRIDLAMLPWSSQAPREPLESSVVDRPPPTHIAWSTMSTTERDSCSSRRLDLRTIEWPTPDGSFVDWYLPPLLSPSRASSLRDCIHRLSMCIECPLGVARERDSWDSRGWSTSSEPPLPQCRGPTPWLSLSRRSTRYRSWGLDAWCRSHASGPVLVWYR